jgi:hypothetical protein
MLSMIVQNVSLVQLTTLPVKWLVDNEKYTGRNMDGRDCEPLFLEGLRKATKRVFMDRV